MKTFGAPGHAVAEAELAEAYAWLLDEDDA
jgi:hypothetical protein